MKNSIFFLLLLSFISIILNFTLTDVIKLNEKTFNELILKPEISQDKQHIALVKFFAPWCGHCRALAPIYKKLSNSDFVKSLSSSKNNNNKYKLTIGSVDCTKESSICSKMSIRGYPSLLFFYNGKMIDEYWGRRSEKDLENYIKQFIDLKFRNKNYFEKFKIEHGKVMKLSDSNFDKFTFQPKTKWVIVFHSKGCGHCRRFLPIFHKFAKNFENNEKNKSIFFGEISVSGSQNSKLAKLFNIRAIPAIYIVQEMKVYKYPNNLQRNEKDLLKWITTGYKNEQNQNYVSDRKLLLSNSHSVDPSSNSFSNKAQDILMKLAQHPTLLIVILIALMLSCVVFIVIIFAIFAYYEYPYDEKNEKLKEKKDLNKQY